MAFYDETKDSVSKPWATYQNTLAGAQDTAAKANATALASERIGKGIAIRPASVKVGAKVTLTPNAQVPHLVWSSATPAKATVDQNGVVTGVSAGTSVITAKQVVKGKPTSQSSATVTVTV